MVTATNAMVPPMANMVGGGFDGRATASRVLSGAIVDGLAPLTVASQGSSTLQSVLGGEASAVDVLEHLLVCLLAGNSRVWSPCTSCVPG